MPDKVIKAPIPVSIGLTKNGKTTKKRHVMKKRIGKIIFILIGLERFGCFQRNQSKAATDAATAKDSMNAV